MVKCPECGRAIPITTKVCANCRTPFTVGSALNSVIEPPRQRWREALHRASPETKRRAQWLYLLLSGALLWWLLAYVAESQGNAWVKAALLSVIFLATLGLLLVFLVPRHVVQKFSRRSPRLMKLAFVVNYLTGLLLLQIAIGEWWDRALTLAGLLVVTYVGAMVLCRLLWPAAQEFRGIYERENQGPFDPSAPQGRRGRFD